jgi:hypothetical protein
MAFAERGTMLPSRLRHFQENTILLPSPMAAPRKFAAPGWLVSMVTAALLLVIAAWFLPRSGFAQRLTSHRDAFAGSGPALGAFPSFSKYVEVTAIRPATDTGNSEIRYVVVNHAPTDLPAFTVSVSVIPARGGAPLFSFSASLASMAANEAREMRTTIPKTLHAAELPDWQDVRADVRVTAKQ